MDTYNPTARARPKPKPQKVRCYRCHGKGQTACSLCGGSGKVMAGGDVNGHPTFTICDGCLGRRVSRCPTCHGQLFI